MKCQKCFEEFAEKNIEESHDIPKYVGGNDAMGRHHLCKQCHLKYENEVMKVMLLELLSNQEEKIKLKLRIRASIVKSYFFKSKKRVNGDGN